MFSNRKPICFLEVWASALFGLYHNNERQRSECYGLAVVQRWMLLLALAGLATACSDSPETKQRPYAKIVFPPTYSISEASSISVRGIAADKDEVIAVSVNGVEAVSLDGFENWQVVVNLESGFNRLLVRVESSSGAVSYSDVAYVERQQQLISPSDLAYDAVSDRIYVADTKQERLTLLDLESNQILAFFASLSTGPQAPSRLLRDSFNDRLLALSSAGNSVTAVSLATGAQTTLTDPVTPDGSNPLDAPIDFALNPSGDSVWVLNNDLSIIEVNLADGVRTEIGDLASLSPALGGSIIFDELSNRLLIGVSGQVIAFDLTNSSVSVQADFTSFTDHLLPGSFALPRSMVFDAVNQRVLVAAGDRLLSLDLVLDTYSELLNISEEIGVILREEFTGLEFGDSSSEVLALVGQDVYQFDLATGTTRLFASTSTQLRPELVVAGHLAFDESTGIGLVSESVSENFRLLRQNYNSGYRSLFSEFDFAADDTSLVLDLPARKTYVGVRTSNFMSVSGSNQIFEINVDTADISLISGAGSGSGVALSSLDDMVFDKSRQQLIALDSLSSALVTVQLTSGDREVLSDSSVPTSDNPFGQPVSLADGVAGDTVFVLDSGLDAIIEVSLETGVRTIISNASQSTADTLFSTGAKLAFDGAERIFVARDDGIIEVDRFTGLRTRLASDSLPIDNLGFDSVSDVVYDAFCDCLHAAYGDYGILTIDTQTGESVVLSL